MIHFIELTLVIQLLLLTELRWSQVIWTTSSYNGLLVTSDQSFDQIGHNCAGRKYFEFHHYHNPGYIKYARLFCVVFCVFEIPS